MRVKDHSDHRERARVLLTHLGARADVAEDAAQGLEKIRHECPDLVLEVARQARRISECAHARLVALTALHDDTAYVHSWSAGFDAHLIKPITLAKLNEIAERFLLGRPASRPRRRRKST